MRFLSISINLLKIFRSYYLSLISNISENSINFTMLGVFWNPQDEKISKLSLDLHLEEHLKEILRVLHSNCQTWVPGLTDWMVRNLREKLKYHRESQKGTRVDAIIQIPPPHFHATVAVFKGCTGSSDFPNFSTRYFLCFLHVNLVKLDYTPLYVSAEK